MDKRVLRSKTAIGDALLEILKYKNFPDITVSELAKKASVDRKTFYAHYSSISDVLAELEDQLAAEASALFIQMENFDVSIFMDGMTDLMFKRFDVYVHIAKNDDYSFILQDGKDILTRVFMNQCMQSNNYTPDDFRVAMEFISSGIIDHFQSWLVTPEHSKEVLAASNETIKEIVNRELAAFSS